MNRKKPLLLAGGVLVALAAALLLLQTRLAGQDQGDPPAKSPGHKKDEAAIRKQSKEFVSAFEKGDAKALAAFWTEEGEFISDDGTTFRGREAIEKAFEKFFAKNPKLKAAATIDSIRFVSRDSAVEEGYLKVSRGKAGRSGSTRYSTLHVRENGRWLLALVRDWPDEGTTLRDLDWLIGTWVAKTEGTEVRTTYQWNESKKFIMGRFTIKDENRSTSGTQRIGRDPRTGQLHSWLFESEGGFGEAAWDWDGKRWVMEATGVQADGSEISATNILTPHGHDAFTWQSTDRMVAGEEVPNIAPVKVTRVK
jgi:uncharacterized protein (TIGR02246 family)